MKIRIVALVSMLALGVSVATAQAPTKVKGKDKGSEVKDHKGKHEKNAKKDDDRDDRDERAERGDRRGGMGWGSERRLMGGIQLTDAQKTSIKGIHQKYAPKMAAIRDTIRINKKADANTATIDPLRARAQELTRQERAEIRAVLTAEQQIRFDQNVAKFEARSKDRGDRGDRGR